MNISLLINAVGSRYLLGAAAIGLLVGTLCLAPGFLLIRLGFDTLGLAYNIVPVASWIAAVVLTFWSARKLGVDARTHGWDKRIRSFVSYNFAAGWGMGMLVALLIITTAP